MQIVTWILGQAARLDAWLYQKLGPPYGVLLATGLTIELVQHCHELIEHAGADAVRHVLPMALDVALLLHTAGALHERLERRQERGSPSVPPG